MNVSPDTNEAVYRSARTVVYRDQRDGSPVVIKSLAGESPDAESRQMLNHEEAVLELLHGVAVPVTLGLEETALQSALVLLDEGHHPLLRGAPWSVDDFLEVAVPLTRVLSEIHSRGVVHRDINPSNIVRRPDDGDVKVIDFGLAIVGPQPDRVDDVVGTLNYLAPEQTGRVDHPVDPRADLYALGATFFELLTGHPPFKAADNVGLVHAHLSKPAPRIRDERADVPDAINLIVAKLLEKQPDERYPSAESLVADLERCAESWEANASISLFELASSGRPSIRVPSEPIGIDDAVGDLFMGLGERLVAIVGAEGAGKSMLLKMAKAAYGDGAIFFDGSRVPEDGQAPTSVDEPFGRLAQALTFFAHGLLATSDDDELGIWRDRLVFASGPHLATLVDLAPDLQAIVGAVPDELQPGDGVHDRVQAVEALLADLGWDSHPVLYFDDVDTADSETVAVLEALALSPKIASLSIVCAASELPDRLANLLDDEAVSTCYLHLPPLDLRSLTELIDEALGSAARPTSDLAAAILPVTGGNPGLVLELLHQQAESGGLIADDDGVWDWSDDVIAELPRFASLVELLLGEYRQLDAESKVVLGVAACFEPSVRIEDLSVAGVSKKKASKVLTAACRLGLVRQVDEAYVFVDDRIQESAEAQLDSVLRTTIHLSRSRERFRAAVEQDRLRAEAHALAKNIEKADRDSLDPEDRKMAVAVYTEVANHAVDSGSFDVAYRYLGLAAESAEDDSERFDLALAQVNCARKAGMNETKRDATFLLSMASDPLRQSRAHQSIAASLYREGQAGDALEQLRLGLVGLGIEFPETEAELKSATAERLTRLKQVLASGSVASLSGLGKVDDPVVEQSIALLNQAVGASFAARNDLFPWVQLTMFELVIDHGLTRDSPECLVGTGIVAMNLLGDAKSARQLAEVAVEMLDGVDGVAGRPKVTFLAGLFIAHLREPVEASIGLLGQASKLAKANDPELAALAVAYRSIFYGIAGLPLDEQLIRVAEATGVARSSGSTAAEQVLFPYQQIVEVLVGRLEPDVAVGQLLERLNAESSPSDTFVAHTHQAAASIEWWSGNSSQAWNHILAAEPAAGVFLGHAVESNHLLTVVLAGISKLQVLDGDNEDGQEAGEVATKVIESIARLQELADRNQEFHGPFARLAEAEWGRHRGQPLAQSVSGYDATVAVCGDRYPQLRALANQRHAELWAADGHQTVARALFREAKAMYDAWQCRPRSHQLEVDHPEVFKSQHHDAPSLEEEAESVTPAMAPQLDVEAVVKATRAISSEVSPDGLFAALMKALVEHAGAQSGALVGIEDGRLHIEASIGVDSEPVTGRRRLTSRSDVAVRAVNFVRRTAELLVVANAAADARFRNDQHVRGSRVRSLACVPLMLRGELSAVLYLENNAITNAFTAEHVELLKVIAGQAAVSIQQVRVFEELEQRVEARTLELADKNREVQALLDHLPQAVVTVGPERIVDPQFSAMAPEILQTEELAGQDVMSVLFEGSDVDADTQSRCQAAVDFSFGNNEFMAKLNWPHLVDHFRAPDGSGSERSFSVDWAPILDREGIVAKMLVSVRDVTALEQAQETARAATRDLSILEQAFSAGLHRCAPFMVAERQRMLDARSVAANDGEAVFRALHTTKGNARMLGFDELVAVVHEAEESVAEMKSNGVLDPELLAASIDAVESCLDDYVRLLERGLGRPLSEIDGGSGDHVVNKIREILTSDDEKARQSLDQIRQIVTGSSESDLASLVADVADALPSLAVELGKPVPTVRVEGPRLELADEVVGPLHDALVHILRNSIDHGLEATDDRLAAGKPESGTITVAVEPSPNGGYRFSIFDDGRGLSLARLREKADPDATDLEVAETIFKPGLSTTDVVSATSGRGVGMDAVREFLNGCGCSVGVEFRGEEENGYRPFAIWVEVPSAT